MHKLLAGSLVAVSLLAPAEIQAQAPTHEFGVDVGVSYSDPSPGSGVFLINGPIGDIRIGFITSKSMMLETRFNFVFASGGGTTIVFDPGLNLLFKMGQGTGTRNLMGMYLTVGADAAIISVKTTGFPSNSGVVPTINAGIGSRMAWGSNGAKRAELFVAYTLKNSDLGVPNTLTLGARLGLSFLH